MMRDGGLKRRVFDCVGKNGDDGKVFNIQSGRLLGC